MSNGVWTSCQQDECGGGFWVTSSTSSTKKYCSDKCRSLQKRNVAMSVQRFCAREDCGVGYQSPHESRYCSRSCSAQVSNKSANRPSRAERACDQCGVATSNPKFCSSRCSGDAKISRTELMISAWLKGEIPMSRKSGELRDAAKKFLWEQAGYKCTECGWGEVNPSSGKVPLCVDHIDGDWRNNFISNLRVLCFNCHTLTPTFGALNIS